MDFSDAFLQKVGGRGVMGIFGGLTGLLGLVWVAFCVGIAVGWAWKPRWVNLDASSESKAHDHNGNGTWSPSPLPLSPKKAFGSAPCLNSLNYPGFDQQPCGVAAAKHAGVEVSEDELLSSETKHVQPEAREEMWRAVTDIDER
uniref:Uncharacterized protein n=1 Tax=Kalanchoe fedtschenkoi TaxID=63787 RepID=A0A7N0VHK2_KALFE